MNKFSTEPVIGRGVSAEIYESKSVLSDAVDSVAEKYGITRRERRRVRLAVGDVNWNETKTVSIKVETFEKIIEWYEETQ